MSDLVSVFHEFLKGCILMTMMRIWSKYALATKNTLVFTRHGGEHLSKVAPLGYDIDLVVRLPQNNYLDIRISIYILKIQFMKIILMILFACIFAPSIIIIIIMISYRAF